MKRRYAPASFRLEVSTAPCVLVLFGATGDLARRKLFVSLFQLFARDLMHATSRIVGCGRSVHDNDSFRALVAAALESEAAALEPETAAETRQAFLNNITYMRADESDPTTFEMLARHLAELDKLETPAPFNRLYYLAIPPGSYQPIVSQLSQAGLFDDSQNGSWRHLMLEKPFGVDAGSAATLDSFLQRHLREDQIFRIDHYLGKDTVQNIMVLRFANILFEPVWNSEYVDHVQITIAESLGVEHRAGYYEEAGLLRDMLQNHMLEMLALVAMEPPTAFEADAIHLEKLKLIRAIRAFPRKALESVFVRGQYAAGDNMAAYRDEPGVAGDSMTETFAAAKLLIDTPRWHGVPFYVRSGKRMSTRSSTITLVFKQTPHKLFGDCEPDALVLRVQPNEGMCLHLQAKRPGPKLRVGQLPLAFDYADLGAELDAPDAYARLLLDAMLHDHTLFVRNDTIAAAWRLLTPVLETWRAHPEATPLHFYEAGTDGPAAATELLERDGRAWHPLR